MEAKRKKILIIHPEGNINNNPNLSGIVEILCENNFSVTVSSPLRPEIYQFSPCDNATMLLEDKSSSTSIAEAVKIKYSGEFDLIIGVDKGIIEASIISSLNRTPYGLISYEILFSDEIDNEDKEIEIDACKHISFAVVQDETRAKHLAEENKITQDKIIYIPVAGRRVKKRIKSYFWHERFNIPRSINIALYIGSVKNWSMIDELLELGNRIPQNWHLIIHNRYGLEELAPYYSKQIEVYNNIHLSTIPFTTFKDMEAAFFSANVGLAFYKPIQGDISANKNLEYIGMSSGKIATYLQHGLPIIINNIQPMAQFVTKYNLGQSISNINDLPKALDFIASATLNLNCYSFFNEILNLDKTAQPLIDKIKMYFIIKTRKNKSSITIDFNWSSFYIDRFRYLNYKIQFLRSLAEASGYKTSLSFKFKLFFFLCLRKIKNKLIKNAKTIDNHN